MIEMYINACIIYVVMDNTISIRVHKKDVVIMMTECINLFLKAHPEMKGISLSYEFLVDKTIEFYIEHP